MNLEIRKLENDLIDILNASPAPIEAKRLILECLSYKVSDESAKVISSEIAQIKMNEKGEKEDGSKVD